MNFIERLRRLEEKIPARGDSGDKLAPAPGSEPPRWMPGDSVCECEFHPMQHVRDDGTFVCASCGGLLLPSAIASIEKN